MNLSYRHESVRLTGRWDCSDARVAVTTAPGSYFEFAFEGRDAVIRFDLRDLVAPYPHLWIELDGARVEAPLDAYLRVSAREDGVHLCRVVFKSAVEVHSRWFAPLHGKLSFLGISTEKPAALPEDCRPRIEFVGDSITEGVLIDDGFAVDRNQYDIDQQNRVYQDDACATYAWLTAERCGLRPVIMGYGAVGITHGGCGRVPRAIDAYPYNFDGSVKTEPPADIIVINHGANDRSAAAADYIAGYRALLDRVASLNPHARLVVLSAFCGFCPEELGRMVEDYRRETGRDVLFVDSSDWLPAGTPLHPLRDGHRLIADHLAPIISALL